jgi:protein SCO1
MRTTFKAGIVLIILLSPAFVITFLHLFGKNHFTVPTYYPKIDSTTQAVIMNGKDTVFHQIPAYDLIDQSNQRFDGSKLKGQIYVADFFFSRCGTICPTLSKSMSRVQDIFINNTAINFVSYTVDPRFDSAEVLANYSKKYEAKANKWYFLTGDKKAIYDLAIKGYFLPVSDASAYDKNVKIDDAFIHSEKLILVDKKGQIRGYYDGTEKKEVDRLVAEIRVLLDNDEEQDAKQ